MQQATTTTTGVAVPANIENAFAVTQATWRFLDNDRVTPTAFYRNATSMANEVVSLRDAEGCLEVPYSTERASLRDEKLPFTV